MHLATVKHHSTSYPLNRDLYLLLDFDFGLTYKSSVLLVDSQQ